LKFDRTQERFLSGVSSRNLEFEDQRAVVYLKRTARRAAGTTRLNGLHATIEFKKL